MIIVGRRVPDLVRVPLWEKFCFGLDGGFYGVLGLHGGVVSFWEFPVSAKEVLRWRRLSVKLILFNHLEREFQFGT